MRRISYILTATAFVLAIASLSGCRFDYEASMIAEDLDEEVPETILRNFSQVMVKDTVPTFFIEAEESMSYGKRKETVFKTVHFQEYDKEGHVVTDGKADNAKMFNETESVELWGNLDFYSDREEASLTGEYLFWNNEESTLTGKPDDTVRIVEKDGSKISGKGFSADSTTKSIRFESQVSGKWQNE